MFLDCMRVRRRLDGKLGTLRRIFDGDLWFVEHDDDTVSAVYTEQLDSHWEAVEEERQGEADVHGC